MQTLSLGGLCRALLGLLVLSGCADDSDEPGASGNGGGDPAEVAALGSRLEGIYDVTLHERNLDACEPGNGTMVAGHSFFALYVTSIPTRTVVQIYSCVSLEECRALEEQLGTPSVRYNFKYIFDDRTGEASLAGSTLEEVTLGLGGDQCYRQLLNTTLVETAPGELRIEARIWTGDVYDASSSGSCHTDTGDVPTMDDDGCELDTIHATLIEGLR